MIFLKKVAIFFFDIVDKYIHQKKILNYLKKNLDYYTVEVYSNSTKILKNQIKIVNNHI